MRRVLILVLLLIAGLIYLLIRPVFLILEWLAR